MYNDDTCTITQWNTEKNGLQVTAARTIRRGEEVSLRCAGTANDYFLMKKGEVMPGKRTLIPFDIAIANEDPLAAQKKQTMGLNPN
jgi:hypothetical protein